VCVLRPHNFAVFNSAICVVMPPPYPGFRGCFMVKASDILWVIYVQLVVVQTGTCCWLSMFDSSLRLFYRIPFAYGNKCFSVMFVWIVSMILQWWQLTVPETIDHRGNNGELWLVIHRDGGPIFDDRLLDELIVLSQALYSTSTCLVRDCYDGNSPLR
jgi:hypothetical protein